MAGNTLRFRALMDDKVSKMLGTIEGKFDKLGKSKGFKSLTQGLGLGAGISAWNMVGSAASAAGDFLQTSTDAARDMTETLSKSRVVFGSSAKAIEDFGDTTTETLGLSKKAAIDAAAGFGIFFTGLGKGKPEAADMSKRLVTLGADLTSFFNLAEGDALDKLQSGLAGEAEPLRRLGVFLTEAKVKAKAMEMGLVDLNGEVSEGAKVEARYALILEETTVAHGDAARTLGEVAGQQRKATASLQDLEAELGERMLPIQRDVTRGQISFFQQLNDVSDLMNGKVTPRTIELQGALGLYNDEQVKAMVATAKTTEALDFLSPAARAAGLAADRFKGGIGKAGDATEEAGDKAETAREKFDKLTDSLATDAQRLLDEFYDPIIARDDLRAQRSEANAQRRIIASKTATDKEKADARAALHQIERDTHETELKLLATGQMSAKEYDAMMKRLKDQLVKSKGPARAAIQGVIDKAKELARLVGVGITVTVKTVGIGGSVHEGGMAHGGPVSAGKAYTVGEQGPETLVMGSQSGTVIPNGGMGGVTINYSPMMSTASAAEAERFARSILPGLVYEMRRQKLLAPA